VQKYEEIWCFVPYIWKIFLSCPETCVNMSEYSKVILKPGKEAPLQRFHPWVFSGAMLKTEGNPKEGDIVEVFSNRGKYLATGHFLRGNISVKVFSFEQQKIDLSFWKTKLHAAYDLRKRLGLTDNPLNNAYRLVFSEGDLLSGLIIDFYNGTAVIQSQSPGMDRHKREFEEALRAVYGDKLVSVYDKSAGAGPDISQPVIITETGHKFKVDIEKGQKTGFFLDQRAGRMFAQFYALDKKVLNAFCYSGAFSVYALKGGAKMVHSVDSSKQAIEWTEENLEMNDIPADHHREYVADVKNFLPGTEEMYDMIILDPPAFAKHHNVSHNALQAYIHINTEAMKKLNTGGILFTFSCSQSVTREMFRSAIHSAAINTGRNVKILHQLSQGPDHPVSIFHPEGEYLKGLILVIYDARSFTLFPQNSR
jgi:23S rRNA (cytosine1962-C5)-methyltransferase